MPHAVVPNLVCNSEASAALCLLRAVKDDGRAVLYTEQEAICAAKSGQKAVSLDDAVSLGIG